MFQETYFLLFWFSILMLLFALCTKYPQMSDLLQEKAPRGLTAHNFILVHSSRISL
jgi:hypothetical protein